MYYEFGTHHSMVSKAKRFLLLMLLVFSICHHGQECFKLGREIFGIENEMPSGNNNENDENKTPFIMKKPITDYNNDAILEAQIHDPSKNLLESLFKIQ